MKFVVTRRVQEVNTHHTHYPHPHPLTPNNIRIFKFIHNRNPTRESIVLFENLGVQGIFVKLQQIIVKGQGISHSSFGSEIINRTTFGKSGMSVNLRYSIVKERAPLDTE